VGIASFVFISMFVVSEMNYDSYHKYANQTYRIGIKGKINGNTLNQAVTSAPMAGALLREFKGVKYATRIVNYRGWLVRYNQLKYNEDRFFFADSSFFSVFSVPMLLGNPHTALQKPNCVVISEETAKRYFGNENPLGKQLRIDSDTIFFLVTGVVRIPHNSHFTFDFLASLSSIKWINQTSWLNHYFFTYVVLDEGYSSKTFTSDMNTTIIQKYVVPQLEEMTRKSADDFSKEGNSFEYFTQRITNIHLYSNLEYELGENVNVSSIFIFVFAALLLLVIASINFMNLATARSATRAKEVGLRKVMGSDQKQLVFQFIVESVFLSFIALLVALVLVEIFTPAFQHLVNEQISITLLLKPGFIIAMVLVSAITGILAGSYPAFILASYHPLRTLKGDLRSNTNSPKLRNILVVSQFASTIFLILCTFTIYRQLNFMTSYNLGFAKEQVLVIKRSKGLETRFEAFSESLKKNPDIFGVATATHIPGKGFMNNAFFPENDPNKAYFLNQSIASDGFAETLKLKLVSGRFFSREKRGDSLACVINKAAETYLKLPSPIGHIIYMPVKERRIPFTIVGIVEDFNFKSLHYSIEPAVITNMRNNFDGYILVRLNTKNITKNLSYIKKTWEMYNNDYPLDYFWLDADFNKQYTSEKLIGSLFFAFSILSIFIACLGLLGLIAFTSLRRTKEIGIRKAMGASFNEIILMLVRDSIKPVIISLFIAWPVAFFAVHQWLHKYSFHIGTNYLDFIFSAMIAVTIAILTISFQAIKAAVKNPADSIRYE
jgi:putative ABC transport system permease protein